MAILALKYGGPTHPFLAAHNGPSRLSLAAVAAAATAAAAAAADFKRWKLFTH